MNLGSVITGTRTKPLPSGDVYFLSSLCPGTPTSPDDKKTSTSQKSSSSKTPLSPVGWSYKALADRLPGNTGWGRGQRGAGSQGRGRRRSRGSPEPGLPAGGSGYLARLGGGRQARVSPVVAPYGHHAGADFVAQFQGEHRQQHDGGGLGEEAWRLKASAAEPASRGQVRSAGTLPARPQPPHAGRETAADESAHVPPAAPAAAQTRPLLRLRGRAAAPCAAARWNPCWAADAVDSHCGDIPL